MATWDQLSWTHGLNRICFEGFEGSFCSRSVAMPTEVMTHLICLFKRKKKSLIKINVFGDYILFHSGRASAIILGQRHMYAEQTYTTHFCLDGIIELWSVFRSVFILFFLQIPSQSDQQ